MTTLHEALAAVAHPRILVLGDLILDRYTFGNAERVSPEAPVVVLRVDEREVRLGGAASVAMLLRALEAEVVVAGVIGDDQDGHTLRSLLADHGIHGGAVITLTERPTTTKERVIGRAAGRHGNQIVRVDHESREPINASTEDALVGLILFELRDFQAVLVSDYAKGVCTPRLLRGVINGATDAGVPVIIDPARITDYSRYAGATLLKPNRFEAELATGCKIITPDDAINAARQLREQLQFDSVLITLDSDGIVIVGGDLQDPQPAGCVESGEDAPNSASQHYPVSAHEVYDITGAGDIVLATLGVCIASNIPLPQAAQLANIAAGLEVEKLGVAPVTREELRRALVEAASCRSCLFLSSILDPPSSTIQPSSSKITDLASLLPVLAAYRKAGRRITFTNGCFDLLHVGHVTMLEEAAALGDILIVAINSDESVRILKGPDRPIIPEKDRAKMLAALNYVDHVLIFDEPTPHKLLEQIQPDVLVKGGTTPEIIGREVVEAYGGRVVRLNENPGCSTTALVSRINRVHRAESQTDNVQLLQQHAHGTN